MLKELEQTWNNHNTFSGSKKFEASSWGEDARSEVSNFSKVLIKDIFIRQSGIHTYLMKTYIRLFLAMESTVKGRQSPSNISRIHVFRLEMIKKGGRGVVGGRRRGRTRARRERMEEEKEKEEN